MNLLRMVTALTATLLAVSDSPAQQLATQDSQVEKPSGQAVETGFVNRVFSDADGEHRYVLFVPKDYSPDKRWPLIVFLHGGGERGTDGQLPTTVGIGPWVKEHQDSFPFLVVFPQCSDAESRILTGWTADSSAAKRMLKIMDSVEAEYAVDTDHRILTGWSMGGYGAWSIAAATPERWSAVVPVSGGGDPSFVAPLQKTPMWAIHGNRDNVVRPSVAQEMITALSATGAAPWFTVISTAGHDVWKAAYGSAELYEWMKTPTNAGTPPALSAADAKAESKPTGKFEPVLEIADAAEVRLGNRLLRGLSYAIPPRVPASALSGTIPNIYDSTNAEGYYFNVTFAGISYSAQLAQAKVAAVGKDRLQLQLGLTNVRMTIGNTYIRGSGRSATAGPVTISIGQRRPVWLDIVVQPYVKDRKLRLRTVSSGFHIESDNWSVSSPWGVSVRGLGMDRGKVSNSIVQGLYSRKGRIESEVSAAVPSIMSWVEQSLDISDAGQGVAAIWPLPVYRPEVRIWPESVSTDSGGVSIRLGLAAPAPTPQSLPFRQVRAESFAGSGPTDDATLALKISASALKPLSQLLVESNVARINVLDIPGESFVPLVNREALVEAIPELAQHPDNIEIQTELLLKQPFALSGNSAPPADGDSAAPEESGTLKLQAPQLALVVSCRRSAASDQWTPCAEFSCRVEQDIRATVGELRDASDLRLIPASVPQLVVDSGRQITDGNRTSSEEENRVFQGLLTGAWSNWIAGQSFAETIIADLDFQRTRLRLQDIRFASSAVVAEFEILPVTLYNLAPEPLTYSLKGPTTEWSPEHVLEPGQTHQYEVDYSLTYRRQTPSGTVYYTLKPGSHSEFRVPLVGGAPVLFTR